MTVLKYGTRPELWGSPEMDIQKAVEMFSQSGNSLGLGGHLNGTDAKAALVEMLGYLRRSLAGERFRASFPPMLFPLTDGEVNR